MKYRVFLKPALQEMEGKSVMRGEFDSEADAQAAIRAELAGGYFSDADFYIESIECQKS